MPTFGDVVECSLALLARRGKVSRNALRLEFGLDDVTLAALVEELVDVLGAADDDGRVLCARNGAAQAIAGVPMAAAAAQPRGDEGRGGPEEGDGQAAPAAATPPPHPGAEHSASDEPGAAEANEQPAATAVPDEPTTTTTPDEPTAAAPAALLLPLSPPADPLTVVLCDLVETPELAALDADARGAAAARVQSICREAAARQHGHVQPWISDGVAILFGHEQPREDDAARAVRCGWEIVRTLDALRGAIAREHGVRAEVRVGVATTQAAAVGDAALAAGRVQDGAEPDRVTVDASTRARADGRFRFEAGAAGRHVVVGVTTPASAPTPLVGRSAERALLCALAERAAAGTRAAALLRGAAGIGKTRLVEALAASARDELGMSVLACAASPSHRGSALHPILSGLRAAWELDRPDGPARLAARTAGLPGGERAVALLAAALAVARPDGVAELPALSPRRRRRETLDALAHALAGESRRAPLLVVIEDLHWADPSTLELVSMLLEGPRDVGLMLALTARGEFLPPANAALQRIELTRLEAHECRAIVELVAAGAELQDGVADELATRASGSPLLAEQLARTVVLAGQAEPDAAATLYGCLMARLDRDSTARSVARLAATVGREIDVATIAAIGAIEPAALDWGLERLVEERVVVAITPGRHAFAHTLLQEAARSSLDMETLREHNVRIARTLLERFPQTAAAEPERVARHLEYAGELAESVRHWQRAGLQALGDHALREATGHFERGIELITRTADGPERRARELELRVLAGLSIAVRLGWGTPTAAAHFARADALSHGVDPSPELFAALQRLAAYRAISGRIEDAGALARAQLTTAERARDPELLVEAECELGLALAHLGRHREALAHLARAVELFDPGRHGAHAERFGRHPAAIALAHHGLALACRGDRDGARAAVARAARMLRAQPHPLSRAWLQCTAATAALVCGEHEVVLREAAVGLRVASEEGFDDWHAHASVLHGWARVVGGDHGEGLAQLRAGVEAWAHSGALLLRPFQHGLLADALGRSGEPELGLRALDEALSLSTYGEAWCEPELHRIRAELLSTVGDVLGARRSAQAAVALARRATAGGWERRAGATLAALAGGSVAA